MQRLIAIVLPEPVAIFIANRWRLVSPGWIVIPCSAYSSRSANRANRLDLGQVDERLNGLALAEVEAKWLAVVGAMLVSEPEAQQSPRGRRSSRIPLCAPCVDMRSHSVHCVGAFAGLAPLGNGVRVTRRSRGLLRAHLMRTSASLVVSLPKMSMIFTTIA